MAIAMNAVTEGHATRPSTPATIEDDLKALWLDIAREAPVARALMANLVVFCECRPASRVNDVNRPDDPDDSHNIDFDAAIAAVPIAEVVRRHPSRVIVLHHSSRAAAGEPIAAAVSVVTFGPDQARYGFEQIAVRSACADASLPSLVRNLTRGDVPTSIWWTEDLSRTPPVAAIVAMGRQLIYDSRDWNDVGRGVLALSPYIQRHRPADLADLNWRRLTALRQGLVHAAHSLRTDPKMGIGDVRVAHQPGEGAVAWLLAGWLASRLAGASAGRIPVRVEEHGGEETLTVSVGEADNGLIASMNAQRVIVTTAGGAPPLQLAVHHESEADAVVAELRTLSRDPCLHDALAALVRHFAA
jgi:glucose-6-phosphate dehydrogenase assembly protein OpcA